MSQSLEIPDALFGALQKAAEASGMTPLAWITAHLSETNSLARSEGRQSPPQSLAELFAGRTGRIASGGGQCLSEKAGDKFTDYLETKKREGHL